MNEKLTKAEIKGIMALIEYLSDEEELALYNVKTRKFITWRELLGSDYGDVATRIKNMESDKAKVKSYLENNNLSYDDILSVETIISKSKMAVLSEKMSDKNFTMDRVKEISTSLIERPIKAKVVIEYKEK